MSRKFYAIVYAYDRNVVNKNGFRADYVHCFETKAEQIRFVDEQKSAGSDADTLRASHPLVKKAIRYARHLDWPQAV